MKKKARSRNLIRVFGLKETKFWKRTWTMKDKMNWVGFAIGLIFITVAHYAFALMHFLFECVLWAAVPSQFRANINKMYAQVAKIP